MEAGDIVYRWLRTSFSIYEIERVTPKCLFLKQLVDGKPSLFSSYRLHKSQLNTVSEWWGIEWATDPQLLLDQIAKDEKREDESIMKFRREVINARAVLQDALT